MAAHGSRTHWYSRPDTAIEALVVAGFGQEPDISQEEQVELQNLVVDVFDKLSANDRWLIEMLLFARLSLRFVAIVVGIPKTTLARRRDAIYATMRKDLANNETVKAYLGHC
jgi:DNA-directed RNA polymerase specialized sigma subunit